jgi:hypothetical protein
MMVYYVKQNAQKEGAIYCNGGVSTKNIYDFSLR